MKKHHTTSSPHSCKAKPKLFLITPPPLLMLLLSISLILLNFHLCEGGTTNTEESEGTEESTGETGETTNETEETNERGAVCDDGKIPQAYCVRGECRVRGYKKSDCEPHKDARGTTHLYCCRVTSRSTHSGSTSDSDESDPDCKDRPSANCAARAQQCISALFYEDLFKKCKKTCNRCSKCKDLGSDCPAAKLQGLCLNSAYHDLMVWQCPKKCDLCDEWKKFKPGGRVDVLGGGLTWGAAIDLLGGPTATGGISGIVPSGAGCKDLSGDCENWAKDGPRSTFCYSDFYSSKRYLCLRSCGLCYPTTLLLG